MKRAFWLGASLALTMATAAVAQQGPVPIFGLVELSGTGTTSGTNFDNGVKLAVKAKNVSIIWVNNDFGKGGLDTMKKALDTQGIKVAAEISTDPGQLDFSGAVLKAKQANADALFVYTNEEESARALRELRKQGL